MKSSMWINFNKKKKNLYIIFQINIMALDIGNIFNILLFLNECEFYT